MNVQDVQQLVLRNPHGPAAAHLVLPVPPGQGSAAASRLHQAITPLFAPQKAGWPCCSIGFSFAGLEELGLPEAYLRIFQRLAPAFSAGAPRRSSPQLGDSGASAAANWAPEFAQDRAHVLVTWHGPRLDVEAAAKRLTDLWECVFQVALPPPRLGERLGAPSYQKGEWVHFGYRDGISEVVIDHEKPAPDAPDRREHQAGALLLGEINDAGFNPFVLNRAPPKVRAFFGGSSFGILRPMAQNVAAFEQAINAWAAQISAALGVTVSPDFVKAKLCGRWPDGRQLLPGEWQPTGASLQLDLSQDLAGEGCPFGSHVRRMRAAPDRHGHVIERPLQRRSMPFGPAAWGAAPKDGTPRGLIGHFFCASIEDQFEHLLGQWAARPPLGFDPRDDAPDPLIGPHADPLATLLAPVKGRPTQPLRGMRAWTRTLGTMYAWYPGRVGLAALLKQDFEPTDDAGPWL
ncbi:MAG: hypothetical protein AD742_19460 [Methylibium sp. NZG]|nr:MAG: hypothetical protein AD742_19460 [Methylibium sp. NZG]